jgi:hypothetical protein
MPPPATNSAPVPPKAGRPKGPIVLDIDGYEMFAVAWHVQNRTVSCGASTLQFLPIFHGSKAAQLRYHGAVRLFVIFSILLFARPSVAESFANATKRAESSNNKAQRRFNAKISAVRAKIAEFKPTYELRDAPGEPDPDPTPVGSATQKTVSSVHRGSIAYVIQTAADGSANIGHVLPSQPQCTAPVPREEYVYSVTDHGVEITIFAPVITWKAIHVRGSCTMQGCGHHPPPPPMPINWLPVSSIDQVTTKRIEISMTQTTVSCDRPSRPP